MKKIEKDLLMLGFIAVYFKENEIDIKDIIPDYDRDKVKALFNKFILKNENKSNELIKELANMCHKGIKNKK